MKVGLGRIGSAAAIAAAACAGPAFAQRSFDLKLSAESLYDSNISRSSEALATARGLEQEDFRFTPTMRLNARTPAGRHFLFVEGVGGYDFHARNTRLNRERISARSGVQLNFAQCAATAATRYERRQSELEDIVIGPVDNTQTVTAIGTTGSCGRPAGFRPSYSIEYIETENSRLVRQNADQDTLQIALGLGYARPSLGEVQLYASYQQTDYPNRDILLGGALLGDGFQSYEIGLRLDRQLGTAVRGTASVGYVTLDPDLPSVPGFDGITYSTNLSINPLGRLRGLVVVSRDAEASNRIGVSYSIDKTYRFEADYIVSPKTTASFGVGQRERDYRATPLFPALLVNEEKTATVFASVRHDYSDRLSFLLDGRRDERDSDQPAFDYVSYRIGLTTSIGF